MLGDDDPAHARAAAPLGTSPEVGRGRAVGGVEDLILALAEDEEEQILSGRPIEAYAAAISLQHRVVLEMRPAEMRLDAQLLRCKIERHAAAHVDGAEVEAVGTKRLVVEAGERADQAMAPLEPEIVLDLEARDALERV